MSLTLVLGGARSGKSEVAESLAAQAANDPAAGVAGDTARQAAGDVVYVAGGGPVGDDPDWIRRVRRHQDRRPAGWTTIDAPTDLAPVIGRADLAGRVLLIDSLGSWLARLDDFAYGPDVVDALRGRAASTIVVSEEVGLGVHPSSASGRRFRDALGSLNREVAAISDRVLLVIAGRVLPLERP